MARPRKARVEGEAFADPVAGPDGDALGRIVDSFKARFPEQWEGLRLGPCQHGIEQMIEALNR